jgi:ankyrin repeat protein
MADVQAQREEIGKLRQGAALLESSLALQRARLAGLELRVWGSVNVRAGEVLGASEAREEDKGLFAAVRGGEVEVVRRALEAGGRPEVLFEEEDSVGTVLHYAALGDGHGIAEMLVRAGAVLDPPSSRGRTPLEWAARDNKVDPLAFLIGCGANVNVRPSDGFTAAHYAAWYRQESRADAVLAIESALMVLASSGADLSYPAADGVTPLHVAAEGGSLRAVRFLAARCNPLAVDREGQTPVRAALARGHAEIVKFMRSLEPPRGAMTRLAAEHAVGKAQTALAEVWRLNEAYRAAGTGLFRRRDEVAGSDLILTAPASEFENPWYEWNGRAYPNRLATLQAVPGGGVRWRHWRHPCWIWPRC